MKIILETAEDVARAREQRAKLDEALEQFDGWVSFKEAVGILGWSDDDKARMSYAVDKGYVERRRHHQKANAYEYRRADVKRLAESGIKIPTRSQLRAENWKPQNNAA